MNVLLRAENATVGAIVRTPRALCSVPDSLRRRVPWHVDIQQRHRTPADIRRRDQNIGCVSPSTPPQTTLQPSSAASLAMTPDPTSTTTIVIIISTTLSITTTPTSTTTPLNSLLRPLPLSSPPLPASTPTPTRTSKPPPPSPG
ncbi:unnamed protein product [Gadus morhua 'NCC']